MLSLRPLSFSSSIFDDLLQTTSQLASRGVEVPGNLPLDFRETKDNYQVLVNVPGVKKENIDVDLEQQILTISVEKEVEGSSKDDEKVHWQERYYGKVARTVKVPDDVDVSKITAKQENGVLEITLPKNTTAKERVRRIEIKSKM